MPQHKSAEKRARQNEKRRDRNREVRSRLRTAIRRFREASLAEKPELMRQATSELDNAVRKGIIKENTANRRKSRMAREITRLQSASKGETS